MLLLLQMGSPQPGWMYSGKGTVHRELFLCCLSVVIAATSFSLQSCQSDFSGALCCYNNKNKAKKKKINKNVAQLSVTSGLPFEFVPN